MSAKQTSFGKFIQEMKSETGLTETQIRDILKRFKEYDENKKHLYRAAIASYCIDHEAVLTAAKYEPDTCPVQDCIGFKDRSNKYWAWICTVGGLRHYLVDKASRISGIPHEVLLRRINELPQPEKPTQAEAQ